MKREVVFFWLVLSAKLFFAQKPELKVYLDAKEMNKKDILVSASVKSGTKYYSIMDSDGKAIVLPAQVEYHRIEAFRFVLKEDTIVFSVSKILGKVKNSSNKNAVDELNKIFTELNKWELHVDHFKYFNEKDLLTDAKQGEKRTSIYKNYKIYGLKTSSFKYYLVRA